MKPITVAVYRHYFRGFIAHVGDRRLSSLRPLHLSAWARTWHQAQAIKRLFNWAIHDARLLKDNPFSRVKQPPKGERHRVMTGQELAHVLRATPRDLRALLLALRETFARPGELRAATWEDLRPNESADELRVALVEGKACIVLHEYKNRKSRRHANQPRVILLSPRVGRLLNRLLTVRQKIAGPLFVTQSGSPWTANALRCRFRRLRDRLHLERDTRGERIVPYTFRHTGATLAASLGVRDRMLAELLGHTETSTTARYLHLCMEHVRKAMIPVWYRRLAPPG